MVCVAFQVPVLTEGLIKGDRSRKLILGTVPLSLEIEEVSAQDASLLMEAPFAPEGLNEPWTRRLVQINGVPYVDESALNGALETSVSEIGSTVFVPHPFHDLSSFIMHRLFFSARQNVKVMKPDGIGNEVLNGRNITRKIVPLSDFHLVDCDDGKIDECLAVFKNEVARCVLVEGKLFFKVPDPVIVIQGRSQGSTLAMRWSDEHPFWSERDGDFPPLAIYGVDEYESVVSLMENSGFLSDFNTGARLKVFDKAYRCDVDTVSMSLRATIRSMMEEVREQDGCVKMLDRLTPRILQLYQSMIDLMSRTEQPGFNEDATQLIEEVISLPADRRTIFGLDCNMAIHEAQLRRWLDRDIRFDVSNNTSKLRGL
jgi:hypothetical protein